MSGSRGAGEVEEGKTGGREEKKSGRAGVSGSRGAGEVEEGKTGRGEEGRTGRVR